MIEKDNMTPKKLTWLPGMIADLLFGGSSHNESQIATTHRVSRATVSRIIKLAQPQHHLHLHVDGVLKRGAARHSVYN